MMNELKRVFRYIENELYTNPVILQRAKLAELRNEIQRLLQPAIATSLSQYANLAQYESTFNAKLLKKHFKIAAKELTDNQAVQSINKRDFTTKLRTSPTTLVAAYNKFVTNKSDDIVNYVESEQIKESKTSDIMAGLSLLAAGLIAYQSYTLARTSLSHVVTSVRQDTFKKNNIKKWQWIATLDNSCYYCEGNHEEIFEYGDDEPPAHVNCNCIAVPLDEDADFD